MDTRTHYENNTIPADMGTDTDPVGTLRAAFRLKPHAGRYRHLRAKEYLFRNGEVLHGVYLLQSGSVKTVVIAPDGIEQIVQFSYPGDLLGTEAIEQHRHQFYAIALEPSTVTVISLAELQASLSSYCTALRLVSDVIKREKQHLAMLRGGNGTARVARFLLDQWLRGAAPAASEKAGPATLVKLPMCRLDIANYLGIRLETMSRLVSRLEQAGLVANRGHDIELCDIARMQQLAYLKGKECPELAAQEPTASTRPKKARRHDVKNNDLQWAG